VIAESVKQLAVKLKRKPTNSREQISFYKANKLTNLPPLIVAENWLVYSLTKYVNCPYPERYDLNPKPHILFV